MLMFMTMSTYARDTQKMQWLFDRATQDGYEGVDFSPDTLGEYVEPADLGELYSGGGPKLLARIEGIHSLAPTPPKR